MGYKLLPDGSITPQYVSILSYGGIFWTIILLLVMSLAIILGISFSRKGVLSNWYWHSTTSRLIVFGAFYFYLYHTTLLSFLYSDDDLLNGLMMVMLVAITLPFGVVIGYSFED